MKIGPYSFEEYISHVTSFHGNLAPGVLLGGFMVSHALKLLPAAGIYDALSETSSCLPDALQLLTPCTTGNGWLTVVDLGRFACALYDKVDGKGVRVFLDCSKVDHWPAIRSWYLRLVPKKEQNLQQLLDEIREAGSTICGIENVVLREHFLVKKLKGTPVIICPSCGEAYPGKHGRMCRVCQGSSPYAVPQSKTISHSLQPGLPGEKKSTVPLLESLLKHETSY